MLTEIEKEELFNEFALRMAEEDKEDQKLAVRRNNAGMKEFSKYYDLVWYGNGKKLRDQDIYGIYDAYKALRKVVPIAVGIKRRRLNKIDAAYTKGFSYRKHYVLDPDVDIQEAEECGRLLLDALIEYIGGDDIRE